MKLIFLDADGTLLHKDGYIPQSTFTACQKAQEKGHKICLCTGRQIIEVYGDLKRIKYDACVCGTGSTVLIGDTILYNSNFDKKNTQLILHYFIQNHIPFIIENSQGLYGDKKVIDILNQLLQEQCKEMSQEQKDQYSLIASITCVEDVTKIPFNKLCFIESPVSLANIQNQFEKDYAIIPTTYAPFGPRSGEITRKDITKATGIESIQKYFNISKKDTISIGDGFNDFCMFDASNYSIAMGNASKEVQAYADYVTNDIDHDGIYHAFEHLKLI